MIKDIIEDIFSYLKIKKLINIEDYNDECLIKDELLKELGVITNTHTIGLVKSFVYAKTINGIEYNLVLNGLCTEEFVKDVLDKLETDPYEYKIDIDHRKRVLVHSINRMKGR